MPIETKIAPVGKSYFALDFQADVVVCFIGGAKVYELLDNIEIIAVCRDLGSHTRHVPTLRQHIFLLALIYRLIHFRRLPFDSVRRRGDISHRAPRDVNVVSVLKKVYTLVENSAIAMHTSLL